MAVPVSTRTWNGQIGNFESGHFVKVLSNAAVLQFGFRPFFWLAAVFAVITTSLWSLVYFGYVAISFGSLSPTAWHAHEMVYGYSLAVIAGFLLTATSNWTGYQTATKMPLLLLCLLWVAARLAFMFGNPWFLVATIFDLLFMIGLTLAVAIPIIRVKQWRQIGILSKLTLLFLGNILFYLDALGYFGGLAIISVHGGLYLIIGLILTIASRVYPMFARNGLDYPVNIRNPKWITLATLMLFVVFFINQLFYFNQNTLILSSALLFAITTIRLWFWHTPGIWSKPLLWSLFLSIAFIDVGFLLFLLYGFGKANFYLALHAMAYGGIGLVTLGMMSRVTLGHTGRNVRLPPRKIGLALALLVFGMALRVAAPLFDVSHYSYWIAASQLCWMVAFSLFIFLYSPMLFSPRIDGKAG